MYRGPIKMSKKLFKEKHKEKRNITNKIKEQDNLNKNQNKFMKHINKITHNTQIHKGYNLCFPQQSSHAVVPHFFVKMGFNVTTLSEIYKE